MKSARLLFCITAVLGAATSSATPGAPQVVKRIPLHDGGWDLLAVDTAAHRVLIARSDGVDAVDTITGAVTPSLIRGARFHGVAVVSGTSLAVASEGAGSAVVFDAGTGKVRGEVKTDPDADATIYEPSTRTVWIMDGESGTISIVDPTAAKLAGKITVGGSIELPALDGRGHLFANIEDKSELVEIDIAKRSVMRRIALAGCQRPTGLTYVTPGLLISACANRVAKVTRAADGRPVADIPIGPRPDGAFADGRRKRAYIPSGGDGTLAVIDTSGPTPRKVATVQTEVGARTGAVDAVSGTVYLPAAKFGSPPAPGGRPAILPGTVELLVIR